MADVSYTPVFHHTDWVDKVDRAEAGGPNGFNIRFNAIERDLHEASTVVTQIAAALQDARVSSSGQQQTRITLTPALREVPPNPQWTMSLAGTPAGQSSVGTAITFGVANIALPDRVRLTTVRVVGEVHASGTERNSGDLVLWRTPLRISAEQVPTGLAAVFFNFGGPFDSQSTVSSDVAQVDLSAFRYFITASFGNLHSGIAEIEAIHISFTPPA